MTQVSLDNASARCLGGQGFKSYQVIIFFLFHALDYLTFLNKLSDKIQERMGHLHDGVIFLLRTESFSIFFSYFSFKIL